MRGGPHLRWREGLRGDGDVQEPRAQPTGPNARPSVPAGQVGDLVLTVKARFDNDLSFRGTVTGLGGDTGSVSATTRDPLPVPEG